MTQEAPSNDIRIATQSTGFYAGFNVWVAAVPKVVILALIAWVAASPSQAGQQLQSLQTWSHAEPTPRPWKPMRRTAIHARR